MRHPLSVSLATARVSLIATDPGLWLDVRTLASPAEDRLLALLTAIDAVARSIDAYLICLDEGHAEEADLHF